MLPKVVLRGMIFLQEARSPLYVTQVVIGQRDVTRTTPSRGQLSLLTVNRSVPLS